MHCSRVTAIVVRLASAFGAAVPALIVVSLLWAQTASAPFLDVLLASRLPSVSFYALDRATIIGDGVSSPAMIDEETCLVARVSRGKLELVSRSGERVAMTARLTFDAPYGFLMETGKGAFRPFRGSLVLRADGEGITATNRLQVDEYLTGVLPLEAGPASPPEFLRAQAIASRSAALARIGRHRAQGYDLCGTEHCEKYGGVEAERASTSAVVLETRGKVLIANGNIVDAVYSTNCGGVTAANEDVWLGAPVPYLRSVFDAQTTPEGFSLPLTGARTGALVRNTVQANCAPEPGTDATNGSTMRRAESFRWKRVLNVADVEKRFASVGLGRLCDLQVIERGGSGRVRELKWVGDRKSVSIRGDMAIRAALSVPSSLFDLELKRSDTGALTELQVFGAGTGHGVGMCQHGAIALARQSWLHDAILRKYFVNVEVKQWYPAN